MRVSKYCIYVPLPTREQYALVHGYTGAIDLVSKSLADQLQRWDVESRSDCEILLDASIVQQLESRGYFTEKSPSEEIELVRQLSKILHKKDTQKRSKFFIIPSLNCQLRCTYCFEREVQNKGSKERWLKTIMSRDMVDAAFKAMAKLQIEPTRNPITLYGGEPFTTANLKIVSYILGLGRERGYRFVAITNAVNLRAYLHLLSPDLIEGLLVTLDGIKETHDKTRVYANGRGTFDSVIQNIRLALNRGLKVRIRVNTNENVLLALPEFAEFIKAEHWDINPNVKVYCQSVWQPNLSNIQHQSMSVGLADIIRSLQETQLNSIISAGETIRYQLDMLIKNNPFAAISPTSCGAEKGMYLFDPSGNVYVCTEHVGLTEQRVGTFWPSLEMLPKKIERWHGRTIENLPLCLKCRYALLCSGGCAYHAEMEQGDMYVSHCDRFEEQFRRITQEYFDSERPKSTSGERVETCD